MRLATNDERIHRAGAEVAAVSVDDDERQAGMAQRWRLPNFALVSDPGGADILQPLGLFDPEERGGIALPAMLLYAPDGTEAYRYEGRDFADRTSDDDLYAALDELALSSIDPVPWTPTATPPDDLRGYFRPDDFATYFRGNRFGAIAIGGRLDDSAARAVAREHRKMSEASLEAWDTHRAG